MTRKIEYVKGDATVYDAIERMVDKRIRSLVVLLPDQENDYGVITARDIVFKVLAKNINPNDIQVAQIASKPLICIDKKSSVAEAAEIMERRRVARVFVCEEKKILGVLSLLDTMQGTLIMRARNRHV